VRPSRIALLTANTKMALAVITINTVPTGGLVVLTLRQSRGAIHQGREGHRSVDSTGPVFRMDSIILQLRRGAGDQSERYLRVAFDLEMKNDADRSILASRLTRVNDTLLSYFSDRTADELRGAGGILHVKEAVLGRLAGVLSGHTPKMVYVTDFLIQ
jgi:flagellar basal body-associated protein FliL